MSATFNWAYRPGIANPYGFTVSDSADDVKPANCCYVALFGNDTTGNGSRELPFRSIQNNVVNIVASGVYRLFSPVSFPGIYGDGDVVLDVSYSQAVISSDNGVAANVTFRGSGLTEHGMGGGHQWYDCIFDGIANNYNSNGLMQNCIFKNIGSMQYFNNVNKFKDNCTFYNCKNIVITYSGTSTQTGGQVNRSCIFVNCNISATTGFISTVFSLFYQCNFSFTSMSGGALYPSVSANYTYYNTMAGLLAAYTTAYPTETNPLYQCIMADPLFNNAAIGDFTLQFGSPAKNLSYFGTYVGARSVATPIIARANTANGMFDAGSAVNVTIADDSITLTDTTTDAQIDTLVIVNSLARELARFPIYGFNADRNGQYIDSIADLSDSVTNAGDLLSPSIPYLVENGAISYNGSVYQPGDRLTTVSGATAFTTSAGGTLLEILEAPERHTVMARFSDGSGSVSAGDALVAGNWYFVSSGTVTYNTTSYAAGQVFKAADTSPFSGTGSVILAMSDESYQHYEPGIKPTSNNTGDTRTGSILRGNGDPAYVRGGFGVNEFPINTKFIQIRYMIKTNNLKP